MQQLRGLYLVGPDIAHLSDYTSLLRPLRSLHLKQTASYGSPGVLGAIAALTNLRSLGITDCALSYIPVSFTALVRLTHLDLRDTAVTSYGLRCLGDMTGLRELDLSKCKQCNPLPNSISRLIGLESLVLLDSAVHALPEYLTALPKLSKLAWSASNYHAPLQLEVVWHLKSLQQLCLIDHTLPALPPAIGQLTALTALMATGAWLTEIPASLGCLVGLERIALMSPRLTMLPDALTALTKLTAIDVQSSAALVLSPAVRAFVEARL